MHKKLWPVLTGAVLLATGLVAAPSHASGVVSTEEVGVDLFYDDVVTGDSSNTLILYTGTDLAGHCAEEYPTATYRIRTKGKPPADGATEVKRYVTRAPFFVYEGGGLDAVEFLAEVCDGALPAPVAKGRGVVKRRITTEFLGAAEQPRVTEANRAVGVVRTGDCKRWVVRGKAKLTISPEFSVDHVSFTIQKRRSAHRSY